MLRKLVGGMFALMLIATLLLPVASVGAQEEEIELSAAPVMTEAVATEPVLPPSADPLETVELVAAASAPSQAPAPSAEARSARPPRRAATTRDARPRPTGVGGDGSDTTNLRDALDTKDSRFVLRELYSEITTMAEEMWTDRPPTTPAVWDRVRVSPWYTEQFSRIGLKPVSDFYEVLAAFNERLATGISTREVQDFLKDRNFAAILLALRDMFQKQQV